MIETPTVLILGAGASKPYGYPTGRELLFFAVQNIRNPVTPLSRKLAWSDDHEAANDFVEAMVASNLPSIDYFIWRRPEFAEIGKKVLAGALLEHENASMLTRDAGMRWYEYLWHRIEAPQDDFVEGNKLSIVTFNYDRSLEAYLHNSFVHSHGLSEADSVKCLESIPIVHLYGRLQALDFDNPIGRPYGYTDVTGIIDDCAAELRLIGERESAAEAEVARRLIEQAAIVCFLGFGFGQENLQLLGCEGYRPASKQVYGSAYGLAAADRADVEQAIRQISLALPHEGCLETLRRYPVLR